MPAAMGKAKDPKIRAFIERCVATPRARPPAPELLQDTFFHGLDDEPITLHVDYNRAPSVDDLTTL